MSMRFGRSQGFLRLTYLALLLASGLPRFAIASDASAPIEQLNVGLLQAMKLGQSAPFRQRYDLLAPLVLRAVDLDLILQRGVGSGWRSVPPDQQAALTSAFQRYSIVPRITVDWDTSQADDFRARGVPWTIKRTSLERGRATRSDRKSLA